MNKIITKNFFKLLMGLFVICGILSYQNCASQGGGAAPFDISLGSTSPGALTLSPISVASTAIQINSAYTAEATLTGADLLGISCTWTLTNSSGTAVGNSVVTGANGNSVCVASLTAPAAVGAYTLSVVAINSGGEVVNTSTALTMQTSAPGTSYTLTLSSSSPAAQVDESITLTGTAVADVSGNYTLSIGTVLNGVQTPLSGCSTSLIGTSLSFTCPVAFGTVGVQHLYINLSSGGLVVQSCTVADANCLGTYSIDVIMTRGTPPGCNNGNAKQNNGQVGMNQIICP